MKTNSCTEDTLIGTQAEGAHDEERHLNKPVVTGQLKEQTLKDPQLPVRWYGPIFNPSGYASEAIDFLLPLKARLNIGLKHQNPVYSEKFVEGLAPSVRENLFDMRNRFDSLNGGITVDHNPANGFLRPPDADYCIGRTMYETDRIPPQWVAACNRMDEIWVPSHFNVETFANSGVERDKLIVIPGSVDSNFFDPRKHEILELPNKASYNFLSIFEWSSRKAWDITLAAYLREFSAADDVCLYLRTYQFSRPDGDPAEALWREIREFAATLDLGNREWPRIELLTEQVASNQLPCLYKAADCLVGISRGEGWGRPQHEAMSMGLPVIATNWSGNTEFMTDDTSILIDYELIDARGLEPELWHYRAHRWAEPSEIELRHSMRKLYSDPEKGKAIGARARSHIVANYSREAVAKKVLARLAQIEQKITNPSLPTLRKCSNMALTLAKDSFIEKTDTVAPLKLAWEGSFLDHGSLSHVNRELTEQISRQRGINLTRVGKNAVPANAEKDLHRFARSLKPRAKGDTQITIRHSWPPDWSQVQSGLRIHCQPWEYGTLPTQWVEEAAKVDQVWAYSEYARRVYVDSGVDPKKVKVVPLGINPDRFTADATPMPLPTEKGFKFLFVGGTIHRKGVDLLLQAYLESFDSGDDVCLVIKDFGGASFYKGQTMTDEIKAAQMRPNAPEILHLDCEIADADMPGLYTACDCIVHPYRGEGFGLPVLEGMACGLPAIVTGGGATDDFAFEPYAWRLPAIRERMGNKISGMKLDGNGWLLQPCLESLQTFLRKAYADPTMVSDKGKAASHYVRHHWTWERAAQIAIRTARQAWENLLEKDRQTQVRRSRSADIVLPEVARLGELSGARDLLTKKQLKQAWQAVTAAIQLRPFHPEAWTMLAEIAREARHAGIAKDCASKARAMAPGYHHARKVEKSLRKSRQADQQPWMQIPASADRLSVIMIAKNEAGFIGDCLQSVKDVADQIIVVDTGSTDETVEIAKGHGAELHHMSWGDDFSAARNESLAHARGSWILFIDADEELMPEGIEELQSAMARSDTLAWRIPIVDAGREHLGKNHVPRLFRNAPGLFFKGRIHEQVSLSIESRRIQWGLQHRMGGPTLFHRGYQDEVVKSRNKRARNIRLLDRALEESPNDANLLMNLGMELASMGRGEAALEQYREAFTVFQLAGKELQAPELREALVTQFATHLLGHGQNKSALSILNSPVASASALTATQEFLVGLAHLRLSKHKTAADAFRKSLKKRHLSSLTPASEQVVNGGVDHCLAICLAKMEDEGAEKHFEAALSQKPDSISIGVDFARYLNNKGNTIRALQLLHGLLGNDEEHLPVWQTGAAIAIKQADTIEFATEWIAEAERFYPKDKVIQRQKAELLMLTNLCSEALKIWQDLAKNKTIEALSASVLCSLVSDRHIDCPKNLEKPVSAAFIAWYRRLLSFGQETVIERINSRIKVLGQSLPTAKERLQSAFKEAHSAN
ncbi:MAG: glycosyltransferase [Limisphaerales bacterium]